MAKGKKNKGGSGGGALGRSLINAQLRQQQQARDSLESSNAQLRALGFDSATNEKSLTEHATPLDEFVANAVLAERSFETNRHAHVFDAEPQAEKQGEAAEADAEAVRFDFENLPIPRRPKWSKDMTATELDKLERESFLSWRRAIAKLEESNFEKRKVTPFEKNIQFWRQLWRVVERSDIVVQVVDSRNPLLYRCPDLEDYCKEVSPYKDSLLLINKSDFMTQAMREAYANYFVEQGIRFVFFSAKLEQELLDEVEYVADIDDDPVQVNTSKVLNRRQVLQILTSLAVAAAAKAKEKTGKPTIGMTGYPNVGKSSVINVLFGAKSKDHSTQRVSVAATPGHTKHFQTLHLTDSVVLCDCPGLVFPTFMRSKADLLCNGILPIDNIKGRDFVPAVDIVCRCIPRKKLEETYSIKFDLAPRQTRVSVDKLLETFCIAKGLQGGQHGRLNESFGARLILKDFVNGRLVYVNPPPTGSTDDWSQTESAPTDEQALSVQASQEVIVEHSTAPSLEVDDESVLFDEGAQLEKSGVEASRRLKKHGRKGRKGRDKDPYGGEDAFFGARTTGKKKNEQFTRIQQDWRRKPET